MSRFCIILYNCNASPSISLLLSRPVRHARTSHNVLGWRVVKHYIFFPLSSNNIRGLLTASTTAPFTNIISYCPSPLSNAVYNERRDKANAVYWRSIQFKIRLLAWLLYNIVSYLFIEWILLYVFLLCFLLHLWVYPWNIRLS